MWICSKVKTTIVNVQSTEQVMAMPTHNLESILSLEFFCVWIKLFKNKAGS